MEQTERVDADSEFERIYSNDIYDKSVCDYCNLTSSVALHYLYERG